MILIVNVVPIHYYIADLDALMFAEEFPSQISEQNLS